MGTFGVKRASDEKLCPSTLVVILCLKGKRCVPVQALQLTAVHTRGTPAQPAYPAVHLERLCCLYSLWRLLATAHLK